jgi:hypothetical protein
VSRRLPSGGELGEREQEVAEVALRIERQHRDAGRECLLEQDQPETGLAGAGHPDDDPVGRQVARVECERLTCERLPEREAVGHPREPNPHADPPASMRPTRRPAAE